MTLQPRPASEAASCDPYAVAARDPAVRSCPWDGRSTRCGRPHGSCAVTGHQGLPGGHHLVTERGRGTVPTRARSRRSACCRALSARPAVAFYIGRSACPSRWGLSLDLACDRPLTAARSAGASTGSEGGLGTTEPHLRTRLRCAPLGAAAPSAGASLVLEGRQWHRIDLPGARSAGL